MKERSSESFLVRMSAVNAKQTWETVTPMLCDVLDKCPRQEDMLRGRTVFKRPGAICILVEIGFFADRVLACHRRRALRSLSANNICELSLSYCYAYTGVSTDG